MPKLPGTVVVIRLQGESEGFMIHNNVKILFFYEMLTMFNCQIDTKQLSIKNTVSYFRRAESL